MFLQPLRCFFLRLVPSVLAPNIALPLMPTLPMRPGAPSPSTAPPVPRPRAWHSAAWIAQAGLSPQLEAVSPGKPEQGIWPPFTPIFGQAGVGEWRTQPCSSARHGLQHLVPRGPPVALNGGTSPGPLSLVYGRDNRLRPGCTAGE